MTGSALGPCGWSDFHRGSSELVDLRWPGAHIPRVKQLPETILAFLFSVIVICPRASAQAGAPAPLTVDNSWPSPPPNPATTPGAQALQPTTPVPSATPPLSIPADAEQAGTATTPVRHLTLSAAIEQALKNQPTMRQARAQTSAAEGRVQQARSGYLPQVTGTASYLRTTANFAPTPGASPSNSLNAQPSPGLATYNYFNFGVTATQLIYDFGQTNGRWGAAESAVESSVATEKSTRLQTVMNVQSAFYQAWAQHALIGVAEETLNDQNRHLNQIEVSVKVGVRPDIDLAQARANVANARLQLINTQNAYEVAKDQLNAAMGRLSDTNYEVADEEAPAVEGEDGPIEPLVSRAIDSRPDVAALDRQHESQIKTIRSLRGAYGPNLVATSSGTEKGTQLNNLVPNWNVGVILTWPIFQGGLTNGQVREAEANLEVVDSQLASLRIQIRTQVDQARLAVRAAKASIGASDDALSSARLQLKLAEGRYAAGVGSIIELADAQVAYTNARAQVVQAHFNLSNSRAQLITALGLR